MQLDRPIAIALTLFIILLLAFFLLVPEYNTFKQLRVDASGKKAEYVAKFDYYTAIAKASLDLRNRSEDIKKIDDALPQDPALGRLINFLQATAAKNGLIMKNLFLSKSSSSGGAGTKSSSSSGAGTNASGVKDIVFSMDLTGSYASLGELMGSLEKSSRIFEISSISFGSASKAPTGQSQPQFQTQQTYNFNLQIKTHSY